MCEVPKVHESIDESAEVKTNRHPRQPELSQKTTHTYHPPKFDYKSAMQQDAQLLRYFKQQQVDTRNLAENVRTRKVRPAEGSTLHSLVSQQNLQMVPIVVGQPETLLRVARKLTPRNYQTNDMQDEEPDAKMQSVRSTVATPRAIYVHPTNHLPEHNLKALNDLIGKNPNVQLHGLKQLLQNPAQVKLIMPAPFQTNIHNIALNTQHAADINSAVNVRIPQVSLEAASEESKELIFKPDQNTISTIQAELDASARIHAQKAIVAAQRQALAHVEEQHKALAEAQEEARRVAMEKVRAHNEAISQAYAQKKEEAVHPTQEAESRIHTLPHQVITVVEEPHQEVALLQAHNEALVRQQEEQGIHQQAHQVVEVPSHQLVEVPAHIVFESQHQSQEQLQKLAEESGKAYGGEHEEVSRSKCKTFVNEKLEMFRQQFCNHLKYVSKGAAKSEAVKDFVLELNCAKIERAKNFFSTKLREMYRENRKAFFSLCHFNISSVQLTNEFVFSNNLTDFNENLLRQKRETGDYEVEYGEHSNDESIIDDDDDYYYEDKIDESTTINSNSPTEFQTDITDTLPSASAQKLVARPHFHKHKSPFYDHISHSQSHGLDSEVHRNKPAQNQIKNLKDKEPTNVIVINNSNDNHNHGANVKFQHLTPHVNPVVHKPLKYRRKVPKRHHAFKVVHKKPSVKKILRVSKKIDTVLSKLGHNIRVK